MTESNAHGSRATMGERWMGVELRHLAALAAIAEEGSFRGAADRLGYVQSAVSNQLAHLERLVGMRLVDRSRGSALVSLTEPGRLLLTHVDAVLDQLHTAQDDIAELARGCARELRVGTFHAVAARLLPRIVAAYGVRCPDIGITPFETPADEPLFEMLERSEIDLAFCELPLVDGDFDGVELLADPFVALISSRSPLARRPFPPSLAEIGKLPFVGLNRSRSQAQMIDALRSGGVEPELTIRSDLDTTVQALVGAGIGVAVVPRLSVNRDDEHTVVIELPELPVRTIALIWRRDQPRSQAADVFVDVARKVGGAVVPGTTTVHDRAAA